MIGSNVHSLGHSPGSRQDGFTLVELMVVLVLSAITTAVIYKVFPSYLKVSMKQEETTQLQQQVRAAMTLMSKEIRMAGYDPDKACGDTFSFTDSDKISFTKDSEDDGVCTDSPKDNISYFTEKCDPDCSSNCVMCLKRLTNSATQNIAENIESLDFAYLDIDSKELNFDAGDDPANIRFVKITISVNNGEQQRTLTTTVQCRN